MNPSPNRSSKSRKSSPPHKGDPSEPVVDLPTTPVSLSSSTDDPSAPVEPAVPTESAKPFGVTDTLASVEILQRPHPRPSEEPAVSQVNQDSTTVPADLSDNPASEELSQLVSDEDGDLEEVSGDRTSAVLRHHPIPPPSEPRQYRAVGLVRGRYAPSAEQFTRGVLLSSEGTAIDAVLLGRVMSLVKNHLNLEQEHLWVVYPRTRQQDGNLHTQIMGVWEPETLNKPKTSTSEEEDTEDGEADSDTASPTSALTSMPNVEEGYFSIRGEVIYQSQEEKKYVIVKIKQSPRKDGDKIKFFKLKLNGALAEKAVAHFWDFHVQLEADNLVIQQANDIGSMPIKKKKFGARPGGGFKGKRPFVKKNGDAPRPDRRNGPKTPVGVPVARKEGVPKPVKRSKPNEE